MKSKETVFLREVGVRILLPSVELILLVTSGCALVVNGTTQRIGVSSTPPGATVMIDNQQRVVTPASILLARDESHTFFFKKEGYQDDSFVITSDTSGWVWGNVLIGGLLGAAVDFSTGAARKLSQDSVHVTLAQIPTVLSQTPTAVPASLTTENSLGGGQREAQLRELKDLLDKGLITQEEYDEKRAEILKGI
jgi:hypothetical protein